MTSHCRWSMASKIIVSGPAEGNFRSVLEKIAKLHSKNSFSLAIILGDFFAGPDTSSGDINADVSALIHGRIEIPLPIYFTVGKQPLPSSVIEKLEKSDDELSRDRQRKHPKDFVL
ncbi:MAG: hypothetical protein Q9213_003847 [Squamulea squamosa]